MEKSCKNCEFNLRGKCTGHGNVYEYGETIVDDSKLCDDWSASLEFIHYLQKTSGKHTPVVRLEYFLDIGARPHMSISTLEKN